jgi:predicted O-methyltransferase YrrM
MKQHETVLRRLEKTAKQFTNISSENGGFLSILIKSANTKSVLEVGTSNGYSAIWFAAALKETGGRLTTIEIDPKRAEMAEANLRDAGLDSLVEIRVGDALEEIARCDGVFDFVFIDAEKEEYLSYLKAALPKIRRGGLIAADDTILLRDHMRDYVDFVFNTPMLQSVDLPLDDGVILSYKATSQ